MNCVLKNPLELYEAYKKPMMEDYLQTHNAVNAEHYLLNDLKHILTLNNMLLEQFNLPIPCNNTHLLETSNHISYECKKKAQNMLNSLNTEQQDSYKLIMKEIFQTTQNSKFFILDGPGGSGKTYLWETIYYNLLSIIC